MKTFSLSLKTGLKLGMLGLGLMVSGCKTDELLNPSPKTSLGENDAFATADRVLSQVNGLYASVKSGQFYGGRFIIYEEVRSDEFLNVTNNGVTALDTWRHNVNSQSNEPTNFWNAAYLAINRANLFMEGLAANSSVVSADLARQYTAEAKLLRALTYYSLLQMYAQPYTKDNGAGPGVPLRLKGEVGSGNNDLARSTVAEVYTQVLKDLNEAEQDLPATYATAALNTTRAHKNTAIALKSRVYLTMGKWAEAITEGDKIISTAAPFRAATGVAHQLQARFTDVFTNYTTTESILSMPMSDNDVPGTQNGLASYYMPGPTGLGDYSLNPQGIVGNAAFIATDARRAFVQTFPGDGSRIRLTKFPTGPVHKDWVPVIRYAEVLLNQAEAITRSKNAADDRALALLNAVRGRSNATGTYTSFADAASMLTAILLERRIELLGEGRRTTDVQRLNQPLPAKGTIAALPTTASLYVWPLPQAELNVNKAAVQNP